MGIIAGIIAGISTALATVGAPLGAVVSAIGAVGSGIGAVGSAIGTGLGFGGTALGITDGEFAALLATGVSATVSGAQGAQQADAQKASANYNADIQKNQAIEVENANQRKLSESRMLTSQRLSQQRAIAAAKGISLESESSLSLFDDTNLAEQFRAEQLNFNSSQKSSALNSGAALSRYEGYENGRAHV